MSFWDNLIRGALAAMLLIAVNGCSPTDSVQEDEEKEPHFVLGNSKFNGMEYDGAIDAFQQALEINPHSGQAHYRLAQLYDTKRPDAAAAIYHYQEYLRLDPQAENAEVIRQRIVTCKQQLAADVMAMPTTPRAIRQVEELTETNRLLLAQVDRLTEAVKQWSAYAAALQAAQKNNAVATAQNNSTVPAGGNSLTPDDMTVPTPTTSHRTPPEGRATPESRQTGQVHGRTHVVLPGETMAAIARKQGVSLTALQAANPSVTPKKLRAGQTLYLP